MREWRSGAQRDGQPQRRISVEHVEKLIQQDLVVVHSKTASDGCVAIPLGIPGKSESRRKVQVVSPVRRRVPERDVGRIPYERYLAVDLSGNRSEFVAQPD